MRFALFAFCHHDSIQPRASSHKLTLISLPLLWQILVRVIYVMRFTFTRNHGRGHRICLWVSWSYQTSPLTFYALFCFFHSAPLRAPLFWGLPRGFFPLPFFFPFRSVGIVSLIDTRRPSKTICSGVLICGAASAAWTSLGPPFLPPFLC